MDSKVAVIHLGRLLDESKRGKDLSESLRAMADKWKRQETELQQEISTCRQKIGQLGPEDPSEARFQLARKLRMQELEINYQQQKARLDLESRRDAARSRVLDELQPLLARLVEERGVSVVLTIPRPEVAYASPAIDLTADLLDLYDAQA